METKPMIPKIYKREVGRWFSLIALMMYIAGYAVGFGPGKSADSLVTIICITYDEGCKDK